jgi:hypothetical protein
MKTTTKILNLSAAFVLLGCSAHKVSPPFRGETGVAVAPQSIAGNTIDKAGPSVPVSGGAHTLGLTVPTNNSVAARIENGLEGNAKRTTGNFQRAYAQYVPNMPKVPNVNNASGFDQIQLLIYAACSDLTTGGTPLMQSKYSVQANGSIASNQSALINAGLRMMDQHTGGLATQGPDSAQLTTIFTTLVQSQAAVATNTSKMAFMAVCIAANTAGTTMLGL